MQQADFLRFNNFVAQDGRHSHLRANYQTYKSGTVETAPQAQKSVNMAMDERYLNVHGEILYNNSAVVDDWYLSFEWCLYL